MPEKLSIGELQPGDVVTFDTMSQLPLFEDMVALHIDEQMGNLNLEHYTHNALDLKAWAGRLSIKEILRIPKFYGQTRNLRLAVMDNPREQLATLHDRGLKLARHGAPTVSKDPSNQEFGALYQGFEFTADASSSNGWQGQIQAELYYYPIPMIMSPYNTGHQKPSSYGGRNIHRVLSRPTQVAESEYFHHHEESKEIGFTVLREAMRHAITTPMRN